jgi:hypothetical protein
VTANGTNRAPWIALAYGYVVCLIAVVMLIVGTFNIVDAFFDRASPLQSREGAYGPFGGSLTSFEAYRATRMQQRPTRVGPSGNPETGDTLSTVALRAEYEAMREDRIEQVRHAASKRLVKHGLLILLAIGLFATHWRWVRREREAFTA